MDYRPKFRFQWTWDGYNLIPLNPKAEEVLSRFHCAGEVSGLPLSHSSFIKSFPPVYEGRWPTLWNGKEWEEVQPTGKGTWIPSEIHSRGYWNGKEWETAQPRQPITLRTDPASCGSYNYRGGLNVRPYPRLGLDTDQPHPRLGVWMNDYKIDHRFGTID